MAGTTTSGRAGRTVRAAVAAANVDPSITEIVFAPNAIIELTDVVHVEPGPGLDLPQDPQGGRAHEHVPKTTQADDEGNTTAWLHRSVFPSIGSTFSAEAAGPQIFELGLGMIDNPYAIPNMRLESGDAKAHVRIGWLRSVANVYHAFAVQSFAAELAGNTITLSSATPVSGLSPGTKTS